VSIVAREAAGSMRDALTLLDQLVAFGGADLRGGEVAQQLGIAGRDTVHEAARAALEGDGAAVLRAVDALATQGLDMLHFARQLLDHVRDLVVLRVTDGDPDELVAMVDEERERSRALADGIDVLELQRAFAALSTLVDDVGRSSSPRAVLEMGLVRIATRPPLKDVAELLARLDDLEKRLGGGGGGGGGTRTLPKEHARTQRRESPNAGASAEMSEKGQSLLRHPEGARRAGLEMETAEAPPAEVEKESPPAPKAAPVSAPAPAASSSASPAAETTLDGSGMHAWQSIVHALRDAKPALAAILEHGAPLSVTRERIVIGFPEGSFFGKQAEADEARNEVAEAARKVVGGKPEVVVRSVSAAEAAPAGPSVAELEAKRRMDAQREREQEAMRHPLVRGALEVFPEGAGSVKVNVEQD
jgi:DNA polymerase-3 subunit gamma/tau